MDEANENTVAQRGEGSATQLFGDPPLPRLQRPLPAWVQHSTAETQFAAAESFQDVKDIINHHNYNKPSGTKRRYILRLAALRRQQLREAQGKVQ